MQIILLQGLLEYTFFAGSLEKTAKGSLYLEVKGRAILQAKKVKCG